MKRFALSSLTALVGCLPLFACGGEESMDPGQTLPPSVASVAVTPSTATLVSFGETVQLAASAQDASGTAISGKTFTWSSSDANIATVSASGLVTAVANGSVTIMATSDGVSGTAAVDVNQVAAQLTFTVQPTDVVAGEAMTPAIEVVIHDANGNVVDNATVTVAIGTNPSGGTLSGTATVNAVGGVASFGDLSIDKAGSGYMLSASVDVLASATSAAFGVAPAAAAQLAFTVQPTGIGNNQPITPAVTVAIQDQFGNTVTTATDAVTLAIGTNPSGGMLSGTKTVNPVDGIATFADLGIDRPGSGYTLVASSGSLTNTSSAFDIFLTFAALAAGNTHTCGVTTGGDAFCWGQNVFGQLGDGTTTDASKPVAVSGGVEFRSVSAYGNVQDGVRDLAHTCGVAVGGAAQCWGLNSSGQLGNGTFTNSSTPVVVSDPVSGPVSFESVSVAIFFTCALATTGDIYCWGGGQLGNGTTLSSSVPVLVSDPASGPVTFVSVSAGGSHTCALASNGQVFCWGVNSHGQLGNGTTNDATVPAAVSSTQTFESVSVGQSHTCGVTTGGDVYCWGENAIGQLGNGTQTDASQPVLVSNPAEGPVTFLSVSGGLAHTCGVTNTGVVYCWGFNSHGQLGRPVGFGPVPVRVLDPATGPVTFESVTAGGGHTCAVTDGGASYCWGRNNRGQLGTSEPTTDFCQGGGPCTFTPVRVSPPQQR